MKSKDCKCKKHKKKKKLIDYLAEIDEVKLVAEAAYQDGLKYAEKKVAKALKDGNYPIEFTMKITGLTEKEILDF